MGAHRQEAAEEASKEPLLSSFLYASILSHSSFKQALASVLANRLSDATMLATALFEIFYDVLDQNPEILQAALADISAVRERVRVQHAVHACTLSTAWGHSFSRGTQH